MIAALWSNPNWDDTKENKGARRNVIESINSDHEEAIDAVEAAFSNRAVANEEKLSDNNPFFAATERGLQKVERRVKEVRGELPKPEESVNYMEGLDQE